MGGKKRSISRRVKKQTVIIRVDTGVVGVVVGVG